MAVEYGSEQERADDGNNAAVPRQQGTDVNLNYDVLPVPFSEVGSVDSAGTACGSVGDMPVVCRAPQTVCFLHQVVQGCLCVAKENIEHACVANQS